MKFPENEMGGEVPGDTTMGQIMSELEREPTLDEKIKDAQAFSELYGVLIQLIKSGVNTIKGSSKEYSIIEIMDDIEAIQYSKPSANIRELTRAHGLRAKVLELVQKLDEDTSAILAKAEDKYQIETIKKNLDTISSSDAEGWTMKPSYDRSEEVVGGNCIVSKYDGEIMYAYQRLNADDYKKYPETDFVYPSISFTHSRINHRAKMQISSAEGLTEYAKKTLELTQELWELNN